LMKEFMRNYLGHRNAYTGLTYAQDPAIMGILITNENDLVHHRGHMFLKKKKRPVHHRMWLADTARFADPHVKGGIVAGDGGVAIWPLVLGPARAKQYLLTGGPVSAAEAERIGLVNFVVPAEELQQRALEFAHRLAAGAPLAVRYTKLAVNKLLKDALNVAFDTSTALELVTFRSEDHREALAALREKRPPRFTGR